MNNIISDLHKLLMKDETLIITLDQCSIPFYAFIIKIKEDDTICLFTAEVGKEIVAFENFVKNNLFTKLAVINEMRQK